MAFNLTHLARHEEAVPVLREAVEHLRRVVQWHKDLPTYLDTLGETLRKLGRHEEALVVREDAIAAIWPSFERDPAKFAVRTLRLLMQAVELCELLHSSPSLYLATRFEIFNRLAPRRSGPVGE